MLVLELKIDYLYFLVKHEIKMVGVAPNSIFESRCRAYRKVETRCIDNLAARLSNLAARNVRLECLKKIAALDHFFSSMFRVIN